MKALQEIFDLAISSGIYKPDSMNTDSFGFIHSFYMCNSLKSLHRQGEITESELHFALKEIHNYLNPNKPITYGRWGEPITRGILKQKLYSRGFDSDDATLLRVYSDWDNRPMGFIEKGRGL